MKKNILLYTTICAFLCGILGYAVTKEWIIFNFPFRFSRITTQARNIPAVHKKISLFLPRQNVLKHEEHELLWGGDAATNGATLTTAWLNTIHEERVIRKKTTVQNATCAHDGHVLILSFDRVPFNKDGSTTEKWLIIEGLLASLHNALPELTHVQFLTHQKPILDGHLDFTNPWPITGFRSTHAPKDRPFYTQKNPTFTIMLDPAGDAQRVGRSIEDSFERSITLLIAQALKDELERMVPNTRIIITRAPGEIIDPLQSATFSNRLRADLFISINCYQEAQEQGTCSLFYFLYDPVTDFWYKKNSPSLNEPFTSAHCAEAKTSLFAAKTLYESLSESRGLVQLSPVHGFPFKPLVGVQAPVIGCELGLSKEDNWKLLIGPLTVGIAKVIDKLKNLA